MNAIEKTFKNKVFTGYIYLLKNNINDLPYIGQTWQGLKIRLNNHKRRTPPKIKKSFEKIKYELSIFEIDKIIFYRNDYLYLSDTDFYIFIRDKLNDLEKDYIEKYNSMHNGYNSNKGGSNSLTASKIYKQDEHEIINWVDLYKNEYNKFPSAKSGRIKYVNFYLTWAQVNHWFIRERYGLIGYNSLHNFLIKNCNKVEKLDLKIDEIIEWCKLYYNKYNKTPSNKGGKCEFSPYNDNWNNIEKALIKGHRGVIAYKYDFLSIFRPNCKITCKRKYIRSRYNLLDKSI